MYQFSNYIFILKHFFFLFFSVSSRDERRPVNDVEWKDENLSSVKGDIEYVRPLKISQNQYEDPRKCNLTFAKKKKKKSFLNISKKILIYICKSPYLTIRRII